MLDNATVDRLDAMGLGVELLSSLGVETSTRGCEWIEIPYTAGGKLVSTKHVNLDTGTGERKGKRSLYNIDALSDPMLAKQPVIICQDEVACWSVISSGIDRVVALPDSKIDGDAAQRFAYLRAALPAMKDAPSIVLAMDDTEEGTALLNELALALGKHRCKWLPYPRVSGDSEEKCKGLAHVARLYGNKGVVATLQNARWVKIGGLYRLKDIPPQPEYRAVKIGIAGLDNHAWLRPGDFWVIGGAPSSGKSTLLNQICAEMALRENWNICLGSFEQRRNDMRRNLRTFKNGMLERDQTQEQKDEADQWINERFVFLYSDEETDRDLGWLLERMAAAVTQEGCKLCALDPWNEVEHKQGDMNKADYTSWGLRKLKRFGEKYQVPVILLAHPAKPTTLDRNGKRPKLDLYSLADSAAFYNRPDIGIMVRRDGTDTTFWTQKVRYDGVIGRPGEVTVRFDIASGRYFIPARSRPLPLDQEQEQEDPVY